MTTTDPTRRGGHPAPPAAPADLPPPPSGPGPGATDLTATAPQPATLDLDVVEAILSNPLDDRVWRSLIRGLVAEVRRQRAELERWRTGRRWHSLPPVPQVPDAIPHAAAMIRAASDDELPELVAELLRSGALRLKSAADAYGIVAAKLAEATADRLTGVGQTYETVIARLRAELDAAPAGRFELPTEPPVGTEVWDSRGCRWERRDRFHGVHGWRSTTPEGSTHWRQWHEVLALGPLSTVPPAGTEAQQHG